MMTGKLKNRLLVLIQQKEREQDRRITQLEIANAVGVSPQVIGRWLRNDVDRFDAPVVEKFCAYFQCDLCDLLYLDYGESAPSEK